MMDFVSDDEIPTEWKVIKFMFQTTNQVYMDCNQPIPSGKRLHNELENHHVQWENSQTNGDFP